ncbi:MAG: DNA-processing protein DprA [Chlorobium sp.]|jgi:predicted Rossmann fold nucleotide-binding protein DprA/Smf involved in DNA uptake|nr:MAG: DNA-processing protein DprA [Chlorobium sp.]
MNDFLTSDTKTILLLCGFFGKDHAEKPLSLSEYSSLVRWLVGVKMRPSDLLQKENIVEASIGSALDLQRLSALLGRGVHLGFAVEEWHRNGIWIISRSDSDYPARYKKHLKNIAPPLLFGVGDRTLLNGGGLGIVGSRNVDSEGEAFTRHVAELCAYNRMPVVSGGARGVDQISMTAALDVGGVAIGILAENLLKKSVERSARHAIADGRLLLISPYHPNAHFTVGTAMGRNKLIYAMADYGLVVSAEYKKGGTWAGAEEELKRETSLPVFVRVGDNSPQGNKKLLDIGAIPWPESISRNNLKQQLSDLSTQTQEKKSQKNLCLFDSMPVNETKSIENVREQADEVVSDEMHVFEKEINSEEFTDAVYQAVLPLIVNKLTTPATFEELSESLNVVKTQVNIWLKKAIDEHKIIKLSRPLRYQKAE